MPALRCNFRKPESATLIFGGIFFCDRLLCFLLYGYKRKVSGEKNIYKKKVFTPNIKFFRQLFEFKDKSHFHSFFDRLFLRKKSSRNLSDLAFYRKTPLLRCFPFPMYLQCLFCIVFVYCLFILCIAFVFTLYILSSVILYIIRSYKCRNLSLLNCNICVQIHVTGLIFDDFAY